MNDVLMRPIDIVFLVGTACVSPVTPIDGGTVVGKVPCAELVYTPVANPYKVAQEANVISVSAPVATVKKAKPRKRWKKRKRR